MNKDNDNTDKKLDISDVIKCIQNRIDELTKKRNNINIYRDANEIGSNVYFLQRDIREYNIKIDELKSILNISDVNDSLIGKKVIWKHKEYTIVDKHNDLDFIIIDDENNSIIGLYWKDVELVD